VLGEDAAETEPFEHLRAILVTDPLDFGVEIDG
jgi:hypothetical protein